MLLPSGVLPRKALAAPILLSQIYIQSVVIMIVSVASLLGAAWMILSYACFKSLRSPRHQLILGLAISDLAMALNFLASTAMNISGNIIGAPEQETFCSFNGFMTQVFVIQTDYWVLTIAIFTYFILADHKRLASWTQDHPIFLLCLPWTFSLLWAGIGLKTTGYGDIGAWCWFTSDKVRLLANFVPRWAIIVTILAMYARLYFVLRRAHRSFNSFGNLSSGPTSAPSNQRSGALTDENRNDASARPRLEKNNKKLKNLARLMLMYPIAYMLVWTLPTAIRIYQTAKGVPAPFALQTVDKACIVSQGLIDAIIYGINEATLSRWRELLFPKSFPVPDEAGGGRSRTSSYGRRSSIPTYGIDNVFPNDTSSSLEIIHSAANSTTRITRVSADIDTKSIGKAPGVELVTIGRRQRGSVPGKGSTEVTNLKV